MLTFCSLQQMAPTRPLWYRAPWKATMALSLDRWSVHNIAFPLPRSGMLLRRQLHWAMNLPGVSGRSFRLRRSGRWFGRRGLHSWCLNTIGIPNDERAVRAGKWWVLLHSGTVSKTFDLKWVVLKSNRLIPDDYRGFTCARWWRIFSGLRGRQSMVSTANL